MASVRRDQELDQMDQVTHVVQSLLASSKMGLPLTKAETISNAGGASVIKYLSVKKTLCSSCESEE